MEKELINEIREIYTENSKWEFELDCGPSLTSVYIKKALVLIEEEILGGRKRLSPRVKENFIDILDYMIRTEEEEKITFLLKKLKLSLITHKFWD